MYEVSTAYKNYIKDNLERDYKVKLTVGENVIDPDDIFSYSIETNQPSDKYTIGNAISQMLKIEIKNQEKPFYTNQLYLQIGMLVNGSYEYVPIGYFNVDKSEKKDHRTTLTCYDNMYKLEGLYVCNLGSTKTIKDILTDIGTKTGIVMAGDNYNNYTINDEIVGYSCREVVAMMAGLNGGNAYIDRTGKIKFVYLSDKATEWAINDYYLFDGNSFKEQSYTIDKVTCYKDKNTSWSNGNLGTTPMTIEYENPFMTQAIAKDIYDKLANITYQAFSMDTMSYLALDVGDWITYTSQNNTVYSLCIQHYKFGGGIKQTLEAKVENNKNNFNASGSLTQKVNRTITDLLAAKKAIIDKANISDLVAGKITFKTINGGSATIQDILTQFIGGDNGQFLHLTADNIVIDEAVIKDLIASKISVSDLIADYINTNKIKISSEDGGMVITGNTQQFKDKNGKVRLQLGRDAEGNFTFVLVGADGTTSIINENGITKDAIPDKVIVNDMVADNANINAKKLDIDSLIKEVNNNNTESLKASKIALDTTGQTLDVEFTNLTQTINNIDSSGAVNLLRYSGNVYADGLKWNGIGFNTGDSFNNISKEATGVDSSYPYFYKLYTDGGTPYVQQEIPIKASGEKKYTISFDYQCNNSDLSLSGINFIRVYVLEEHNNSGNYYNSSQYSEIPLSLTLEKHKWVLKLHPETTAFKIRFDLSSTVHAAFRFGNIKVEEGTKATPWSPNPEDVIEYTNKEVDTLQTKINVANGQIDTLIKDTTITEGNTTKKLKDAYNQTKSTVEGTLQTVTNLQTIVNGIDTNNLLRYSGGEYKDVTKWAKYEFVTGDNFNIDGNNYRIYNSTEKTICVTNTSSPINSEDNKTFSISFKYECNDANISLAGIGEIGFYILQEYNNNGNYYSNHYYTKLTPTLTEKYFSKSFTVPDACTKFMIRFDLTTNSATSAAFRFGDITINTGSVPIKTWSPCYLDVGTDINGIETRTSKVEQRTTDEAFTVQVTKNKNKVYKIRYIRDYCNGSNANGGNHWVEIKAFNNLGNNLALNKTVTTNGTTAEGNLSLITDGDTSYDKYVEVSGANIYAQVDLGTVYDNIDEIKIWHYYADNRVYKATKTEVSADGVNWIRLFDSDVSGTYAESIYGHSIKVNNNSFNSSLVTVNEMGLDVRNGSITISNNKGTKVLKGDRNGNLTMLGVLEQYDSTTGKKSIEISRNQLKLYDWELDGDFVGGIASTRKEGTYHGYMQVYGDTGNPLVFGMATEAGKDGYSKISMDMMISDNGEYRDRIAMLKDVGLNYYSDLRLYGNDSRFPCGIVGLSTNNSFFLTSNNAVGNNIDLGEHTSDTSYNYYLSVCHGGSVVVNGNFSVNGSKNRVVKTSDYGWLATNAYETAECYFGDIMEAKTDEKGLCYIYFDSKFLKTINTKCKYQVDIYGPYGDENMADEELKSLWVRCIKREELYFVIKGSPNTVFGCEVKCKQLNYEADRLERRDINNTNGIIDYKDIDEAIRKEKEADEILESDLNLYDKFLNESEEQ